MYIVSTCTCTRFHTNEISIPWQEYSYGVPSDFEPFLLGLWCCGHGVLHQEKYAPWKTLLHTCIYKHKQVPSCWHTCTCGYIYTFMNVHVHVYVHIWIIIRVRTWHNTVQWVKFVEFKFPFLTSIDEKCILVTLFSTGKKIYICAYSHHTHPHPAWKRMILNMA